MVKDMQIIPLEDGDVEFSVLGKISDESVILLQRVYVLLLSDTSDLYRTGAGTTLMQSIVGANITSVDSMDALLAVSCNKVLAALDSADRARIRSLSAVWQNSSAQVTVVFSDGNKIQGVLK